jgi:adenosylhomocysteine nucleosidase
MSFCARFRLVALSLCLLLCPLAQAADTLDATPRTAVISAFDAELALLLAAATDRRHYDVNGVRFTTGNLAGKPVVLLLSGVSMTNAAMTTQLLLDRFAVERIVFSGIAGGVNPALHIGDVNVPEQWASYLEAIYAREVAPGEYRLPQGRTSELPNFDMVFPRPVRVLRASGTEQRTWFPVDAGLLALARSLKDLALDSCFETACLKHKPTLVVGGNGVAGQAFVDNARFREYTFRAFGANVLDMESSAIAQVAYVNEVPFIIFRSLSDLAGGGEGENEARIFGRIAANNSARVVMAFVGLLPKVSGAANASTRDRSPESARDSSPRDSSLTAGTRSGGESNEAKAGPTSRTGPNRMLESAAK